MLSSIRKRTMKAFALVGFVSGVVLFTAQTSAAESIIVPITPPTVNDQCAFTDDDRSFEDVVDVGSGKFVQRLTGYGASFGFIFADCGTGEFVIVHETSPERGTVNDPFRVNHRTTVHEVIAVAQNRKVEYFYRSVLHLADQQVRRNDLDFDPLCGCSVLYPRSKGANMSRLTK